jgi:hypothetical protein
MQSRSQMSDRRDLARRRGTQGQYIAGGIVDQAENPNLEIALALQLDEEGTFDVDVPERIDVGALAPKSGRSARSTDGQPSDLRRRSSAEMHVAFQYVCRRATITTCSTHKGA